MGNPTSDVLGRNDERRGGQRESSARARKSEGLSGESKGSDADEWLGGSAQTAKAVLDRDWKPACTICDCDTEPETETCWEEGSGAVAQDARAACERLALRAPDELGKGEYARAHEQIPARYARERNRRGIGKCDAGEKETAAEWGANTHPHSTHDRLPEDTPDSMQGGCWDHPVDQSEQPDSADPVLSMSTEDRCGEQTPGPGTRRRQHATRVVRHGERGRGKVTEGATWNRGWSRMSQEHVESRCKRHVQKIRTDMREKPMRNTCSMRVSGHVSRVGVESARSLRGLESMSRGTCRAALELTESTCTRHATRRVARMLSSKGRSKVIGGSLRESTRQERRNTTSRPVVGTVAPCIRSRSAGIEYILYTRHIPGPTCAQTRNVSRDT